MARVVALALGLGLWAAGVAQAHGFSVFSPIVEQGELELELTTAHEWSAGTKSDDGAAIALGLGYGVSDTWFTEVEFAWHRAPGGPLRYGATEWENRVQLTEQGRYWLDVGLFGEIEIPAAEGEPFEVVFGPLLQKELGSSITIVNLLLEKQFGDNAEAEIEFQTRWQTRWLLGPAFEPGIEVFAAGDKTRVGPVVLGSAGGLKYEVGYLAGLTDVTADHTLKAVLELEF